MENSSEQPIRLSRIVRHMERVYGLRLTRQTIYNWVKSGVSGVKLQSQMTPVGEQPHRFNVPKRSHYLTTTIAWVDEFLTAVSASTSYGGE